MNYKTIITDTAKQDLKDIIFWIASESGSTDIAKKFGEEFKDRIKSIGLFPEKGSYPDDYIIRSMDFRYIVYKDYLIFYKINEPLKEIIVSAVFNSKKDYTRVLKR